MKCSGRDGVLLAIVEELGFLTLLLTGDILGSGSGTYFISNSIC